jgi:N-acetylmuramoyl-L-alanine amidase
LIPLLRPDGSKPRQSAAKRLGAAALLLAAATLITLAALPASGARGPAITIVYPDPRSAERITPTVIGGARYVSTNDLARIFSATKYWRPDIQKLSLRMGDHTLRFTVGAPLVLLDETEWNAVMPARLIQGIVFVPETVIGKMFESGRIADATWDETSRTIRFRSPVHTVRQAILTPRGRVTEISATLLRSIPPRVLYATPSEIRLVFEGSTLDTARTLIGGVVVDGAVREIPGAVEMRLRLADGARGYAVSVASGRVRISITDDPGLVDAGLFTQLEPVAIGAPGRGVRTIVIDPGHGGSDRGASLSGGLEEKDAALDMARALRTALVGQLGARVFLTRESDTEVSATRRAEIANESNADLFISIHMGSDGALRGGGFRVLTLSPLGAGSDGQRDAMPEEIDGIPLRPWFGAQSSSIGSSLALAQTIADSLSHAFPHVAVRMGSGRVRVLGPVSCPAILLESAPAARAGAESVGRSYTIYDYTRTVAAAIGNLVRASRG